MANLFPLSCQPGRTLPSPIVTLPPPAAISEFDTFVATTPIPSCHANATGRTLPGNMVSPKPTLDEQRLMKADVARVLELASFAAAYSGTFRVDVRARPDETRLHARVQSRFDQVVALLTELQHSAHLHSPSGSLPNFDHFVDHVARHKKCSKSLISLDQAIAYAMQ